MNHCPASSQMQAYGNRSGDSGVVAFALEKDAIIVQFREGAVYRYSVIGAGAAAVRAMVQFARSGRGLSTFIAQHNPAFEERWLP